VTRPATAYAATLMIVALTATRFAMASAASSKIAFDDSDSVSSNGSLVDNRVVRPDDVESDEEQHEVDVSGANTM